MRVATRSPYWLVFTSFLIALVLEVLPLPIDAQAFRPKFFYLVLIYWAIYSPLRMGLGSAFCFGLLLDILQGNILGLHGLIMVGMVIFLHVFCQRIRMFDTWKQCLLIFFLLVLASALYAFFQASLPPISLLFLPALISIFLWPLVVVALSYLDTDQDSFYHL